MGLPNSIDEHGTRLQPVTMSAPAAFRYCETAHDRVHQTDRAMEARLSLYGFACTVAEMDELVPESEDAALDAFYDALYYDV